MQFQIGETVSVRLDDLTVTAVEIDDDGIPWVTLFGTEAGTLHLPIDAETIEYVRRVPAEGMPVPGEFWGDQVGRLYVARRAVPNNAVRLASVDNLDTGDYWYSVHTGPTGPVFRVAEWPQLGGA